MKRCRWCNEKNPIYVRYHDEEWGVWNMDEDYLFEMLLLESFQVGLSWECVLNKREAFRRAYDQFDLEKICAYEDEKIKELMNDQTIIRNRSKIMASIHNAQIFRQIQQEFGSFQAYLDQYTKGKQYHEIDLAQNDLSDALSKDLRKRGMKYMGSVTVYSFLQAVGIIVSHEKDCFLYR